MTLAFSIAFFHASCQIEQTRRRALADRTGYSVTQTSLPQQLEPG